MPPRGLCKSSTAAHHKASDFTTKTHQPHGSTITDTTRPVWPAQSYALITLETRLLMTDILRVLPHFPASQYESLLPALEKHEVVGTEPTASAHFIRPGG